MKCPKCHSKNIKKLANWSHSKARNMFSDYECNECYYIWHRSSAEKIIMESDMEKKIV